MVYTLPPSLLAQYERFSLYNSPYRAHDSGCAIDLYPGTLRDGRTTVAPSPVSGTVIETRTVTAPSKPYAPPHDHLILIECDGPGGLAGLTARILHVDPTVMAGDRVDRGDSLGTLVRAGFFAPWVDNHLHVGFRPPDRNPHRASGSLPVEPGIDLRPLAWDGTGTVVATGATYAVLDSPMHPAPGDSFVGVGVRAAIGAPSSEDQRADGGCVLDGGLPHYDGGGLLGCPLSIEDHVPVSLNGDRLGVADGRTITWDELAVTVNGEPITGLSLFCARDSGFGVKLICPDRSIGVGDSVRVRIVPGAD